MKSQIEHRIAGYVALTLVLMAAGCTGNGPAPEESSQALPAGAQVIDTRGVFGGTLHYGMLGEPAGFNPAAVSDLRTKAAVSLITGMLLEFDPLTKETAPGVAASWEVSPDGLRLDFTLREGIRFSDGVPVTADDVVFTMREVLDANSANFIREQLIFEDQRIEATALAQNKVRLTLSRPDAAILFLMTTFPVLPRHRLEDAEGPIEGLWNLETPLDRICGLGPFIVESHTPGVRTVFRRNPHYWRVDSRGRRLPYLDRIEFDYIPDMSNQALRLRAGQLDLIEQGLSAEVFQSLQDSPEAVTVDAGPSHKLYLFWFNMSPAAPLSEAKKSWFSDRRFRKAIDLAIDRAEIVRIVFLGHATPASSFIPKTNPYYLPSLAATTPDLERARSLLREAGFSWRGAEPGGAPGQLVDAQRRSVSFEILTLPGDSFSRTAALMQQDLQQLGMDVTLRQEEFRSIAARVTGSRAYDSVLAGFGIPLDPAEHNNVMRSSGELHYWDPRQTTPATEWEREIDDLIERQRSVLDLEERKKIYGRILVILADRVPVLPIVNSDVLVAAGTRVRNLRPTDNTDNLWNAWEVYLNE